MKHTFPSPQTIQSRLLLSIGALVGCIVAFVVVYFPAAQRTSEIDAFTSRLEAVGGVLAITIGLALDGHGYEGIERAQAHIENDPDLLGAIITNADGSFFAAFPPDIAERDRAASSASEVIYRTPLHQGDAAGGQQLSLIGSLARVNQRILQSQLQVFALGALIAIASLWVVRRIVVRIAEPIQAIGHTAQGVAEGRLAARVELDRQDEIGRLGASFDHMIDRLHEIVIHVRDGMTDVDEIAVDLDETTREMIAARTRHGEATRTITRATTQLGSSTSDVKHGAEQLAEAIEASTEGLSELDQATRAVVSNMDEITGALGKAASGSEQVSRSSAQISKAMEDLGQATQEAGGVLERVLDTGEEVDRTASSCGDASSEVAREAVRGVQVVEKTNEAIREVQTCFTHIENEVRSLEEKSEAVGGILEIISSIADETNLLSLNAAIIAAQAGEHGSSFAVVAGQIKNLSQQTAESANSVAELIQSVGEDVTRVTRAVATGASAVAMGFDRASEAGNVLEAIRLKTSDSVDRIEEIMRSTSKQAKDLGDVGVAMSRVEQLARQTNTATEEQREVGRNVVADLQQIGVLGLRARKAATHQRDQNQQITTAVGDMSQRVREFAEASDTLEAENARVESALAVFEQVDLEGEARAEGCRVMARQLLERANRLRETIERFDVGSISATSQSKSPVPDQARPVPSRSHESSPVGDGAHGDSMEGA